MTSTITDRVYGESASVAIKAPCVAVATVPILLTGLTSVGGYAPQVNDRILVIAQTDPTTNGIYNASTGAWARTGDFDGVYDAVQGTLVVVYSAGGGGTIIFQLTTPNPIIGSTPLNFSSFINPTSGLITQAATNKQFANGGAQIDRFNDRVMVGDACINDGNFPNVVQDWLSAFQTSQLGGPPNGTLIGCQMAVLANHTAPIGGAFIAGAETLNMGNGGYAITTTSIAVNNGIINAQAFGYYGEAHRMNNTVAGTVGIEIDIVQRGSLQAMTPYALAGGEATCYKVAAGAGMSATGQFPATAGIVFGANPMSFDKGIVFLAASISGTNGVTGTGYAINMAKGHVVQWWAAGGVPTAGIFSQGVTSANAVSIDLDENFLLISAKNGLPHTQFNGVANAVNSFVLSHAATNTPPTLQSIGSDPNVDLALLCKGTGVLNFGNYAAATFAQTGYITIKDAGGVTRRLMVG